MDIASCSEWDPAITSSTYIDVLIISLANECVFFGHPLTAAAGLGMPEMAHSLCQRLLF